MKKAITHLSSVYSCQLETMKKAEKLGMGGQKDLYKPEGLCDLLELVNHLHLIRKLSVPSKSVNVLTSGVFVCLFVCFMAVQGTLIPREMLHKQKFSLSDEFAKCYILLEFHHAQESSGRFVYEYRHSLNPVFPRVTWLLNHIPPKTF